jgi:anion-transporting  ArsA/GET3 family ATPase
MTETSVNPIVDACRTSRVIAACGTGGVGKTSIAAAMGLLAARSGRRAVVLTIDPARRLADAIGVADTIGNEPVCVDVGAPGEFWIAMLDVRATFDGLVSSTASSPERARKIIENSFYKSLSQSLSGTRDYMAAERLHELVADDRFDLVIVDTPPSRNALDFLESPERLARFLRHPIVRLLVAPGRGGLRVASLAAQPVLKIVSGIVGSAALGGAVDFLRAFEGMEQEFTRRALEVSSLLRGDDATFVVVTGPRRDALREAEHFVSELERLRIPLRAIVANRMPPRFIATDTATGSEPADISVDGDIARRVLADLVEDAVRADDALGGFVNGATAAHPGVGSVRVDEMAHDIHDMAAVSALADKLATGVARGVSQ